MMTWWMIGARPTFEAWLDAWAAIWGETRATPAVRLNELHEALSEEREPAGTYVALQVGTDVVVLEAREARD